MPAPLGRKSPTRKRSSRPPRSVRTDSARFGISIYPTDGDTTDALLKIADEDMYRTKLERRKLQASAANQTEDTAFAA